MKKIQIDKGLIEQLHIKENKSLSEIARMLNVNPETVRQRAIEYNIEISRNYPKTIKKCLTRRKSTIRRKKIHIDKDLLIDMHINQKLCVSEIGRRLNISDDTVRNRLKECEIPIKKYPRIMDRKVGGRTRTIDLDINEVKRLHIENKLSVVKIAEKLGVSDGLIAKRMKEAGIPITPHKRPIPTKDELYDLHHTQNLSDRKIAKIYGVSCSLVGQWRDALKIDTCFNFRNEPRIDIPLKEELINLHHTQKKTLKQIYNHYDISQETLDRWFTYHDIEKFMWNHSSKEEEIFEYLKQYIPHIKKVRFGKKFEIDIYDDKQKIGIKYCGVYWHSEKIRGRTYHYDKMKTCADLGIQLITIFEDEYLEKPDIIKSVLKSKLGIQTNRIYARKCTVKEIDNNIAHKFYDENHIQGSPGKSIVSFGLFMNDSLVAAMSFGKHHRDNRNLNNIILNRLCFLRDTNVIGGSSKLFKFALGELKGYNNIISWSDNRWSSGKVYETLGFTEEVKLPKDYHYVKGEKRFPKQNFTKARIGCPKDIKEHDFMKNLGYEVIWDCGKIRWTFKV